MNKARARPTTTSTRARFDALTYYIDLKSAFDFNGNLGKRHNLRLGWRFIGARFFKPPVGGQEFFDHLSGGDGL